MKQIIFGIILLAIILVAVNTIKNITKPSWIKINQEMVERCTQDIQNNPNIVCD